MAKLRLSKDVYLTASGGGGVEILSISMEQHPRTQTDFFLFQNIFNIQIDEIDDFLPSLRVSTNPELLKIER
jgi:hypothetical protein